MISITYDLLTVGLTSQACVIIGVTIILVATWIKTWSIRQLLKSTDGTIVSLSELLLRDGTLYFIVSICLNVASLVLDIIPHDIWNMPSQAAPSVNAILLCRLMLNLRSYNQDAGSATAANDGRLSSVHFANALLDNIGASVSVDGHDDEYGHVDATLDEIVHNPLAIGLRADIIHMRYNVSINNDLIALTGEGECVPSKAI